jgi:hypothetical protein
MAPTCVAASASFMILLVFAVTFALLSVRDHDSVHNFSRGFGSCNNRLYITCLTSHRTVLLSPSLFGCSFTAARPWTRTRISYCKSRISYYSNAVSTFNVPLDVSRLLKSGDIEINPGPMTSDSPSSDRQQSIVDHHGANHCLPDGNAGQRIVYSAKSLLELRCIGHKFINSQLLNTFRDHHIINSRHIRARGIRGGQRVQRRAAHSRALDGRHLATENEQHRPHDAGER